jgi:hypothetical protein
MRDIRSERSRAESMSGMKKKIKVEVQAGHQDSVYAPANWSES